MKKYLEELKEAFRTATQVAIVAPVLIFAASASCVVVLVLVKKILEAVLGQ